MSESATPFALRLEMVSDWHIGTGAGIPGSIDAMVSRDADGFPCVPAKTIVGIWRDAMETLTLGLDNGTEKYWQRWVPVIFGSQPAQLDQQQVAELARENQLTPRLSILTLEPARLNKSLRDALIGDGHPGLRQALTFIKPSTEIDAESGSAKSESLRFIEMGRVGTVLESSCSLDLSGLEETDSSQRELIEALLVASAALVERIGGKRRRGSGKCQLQLPNQLSVDAAVKTLRKYEDEPRPKIPPIKASSHVVNSATDLDDAKYESDTNLAVRQNQKTATDAGWKRISYSLKLHTPIAIVTSTLGNVSQTLDFIPGTYLLPHISRQLKSLKQHLASGDFQISPAMPEIVIPKRNDKGEIEEDEKKRSKVEGKRGLPVPKVIYYHKLEGGFDKTVEGGFDKTQNGKSPTVYNRLKELPKIEDSTYQKKNYRRGYVSSIELSTDEKRSALLPLYDTTKHVLMMHNTVDDPVQRPTENVGGVFSREAIKAGTTLRGEIRLKSTLANELSAQDQNWIMKLSSFVRLGTSKKDDYGLAELTLGDLEPMRTTASLGEGKTAPSASISETDELVVYLESDLLLRNGNLRPTNLIEDLQTELERTLGTGTLESVDAKSLIQVRRIESWHEGWGFPRPTLIGMAAGSVAVFKLNRTLAPTLLQHLEHSGIGERRAEGYGRICFNPPLLTSRINEWTVPSKAETPPHHVEKALEELKSEIPNDPSLEKFVEIIEKAAWRAELARAVLKLANSKEQREKVFGFEISGKSESIPPLSQIGGLRAAFSRLAKPNDNKVLGWLEHLEYTNNRLEKWARNKNKQKAKEKLKEIKTLIKERAFVWDTLRKADSAGRPYFSPPNLVTAQDKMEDKLWPEAVRSIFDACARAHKRGLEPGNKREVKADG